MWWYWVIAVGLYLVWNNNPKIRKWFEEKIKEYKEYSQVPEIVSSFDALGLAIAMAGKDNKWTLGEIVTCLTLLLKLQKVVDEYEKRKRSSK